MKLLIVLSVIACGYADKLDRTYLPPANAGSSGGSPGSLNTPLGPSGFGQPAGFGQPGANGVFNAAGKSSGPAFDGQSKGFAAPLNQYGQPGPFSQSRQSVGSNFDAGFGAPAQNFGKQAQDYQSSQPQRSQASAEQSAQILRSDSQNDGETFSYSFETSNGISAEESGVATNGVQAQGAFAYSDDDGQNFRVQYTADENGYQPQGDHLPTPPPIPDEILKSIEENARAAASGTQEGAYNPDEDNEVVSPQQYNSNTPTSYHQAPAGQNFNQADKSTALLYGGPNPGPRPQGGSPSFSQRPSQYNTAPAQNAGSRPSNGFGQPQTKSPSQLYSSPHNGAGNGAARPNSFGQQGPSQQYSAGPTGTNDAARLTNFGQQAPSQQYSAGPTSANAATKSTGFRQQGPSQQYSAGPTGANGVNRPNSFGQQGPSQHYSSGASPQAQPQQNQASPSGQFPSARRPQGPAQAQDASGYQYNKPQSVGGANGVSQQYHPQNGAPSGLQGFSMPSGSNAFPSSGPSGQGSFGPSSNSQGSYGSAPSSNTQGTFSPSGSNGFSGPKGPSSFSSNGQTSFGSNGQASFGSPARPNANFGSSSGSQPSFGQSSNGFGRPQAGSNGFSRPQGKAPGSMSDAGYEYNRPSGNSKYGGSQPQNSNAQFGALPQNGNSPFGGQPQEFKSADQGRPGQFGFPRAPPSFSEEEGYKY